MTTNTHGDRDRKILSVSMRPDLFDAVKDEAARLDLPVTVWVREAIQAYLGAATTKS